MKCLICGRQSLPGAKLCLDCKAARKRAFDATVTQPLLAAAGAAGAAGATRVRSRSPRLLKAHQPVPDAARRAAKMALAAQAQSSVANEPVAPVSRRAIRWPIVVGGACLALAVFGYLGHWFGGARTGTLAAVPETLTAVSSVAPASVSASIPSAVSPQPAALASEPVPDAALAEQLAPPKADAKRPNSRPRAEKAPIVVPIPEPPPAPEVVAVAPAPPPVREAPRVDPFQPMYDAIARCPRDISGRASCEQRLRAQFCEGHWGQVSQCASIPYIDHGS